MTVNQLFFRSPAFYIASGAFLLFLYFGLIPRHYNTPAIPVMPGTQYWDLATGSHIAFWKKEATTQRHATPVIYIHGGPGGRVTSAHIAALTPLAGIGYDVYWYDQTGSGYSDRLDNISDYTVQRHIDDLRAIIRQIGSQKVILIGQSWGALLITAFLGQHPEQVEKVIFTGPGPVLPIRRELAAILPPDSLHLRPPEHTNEAGNRNTSNLRSKLVQWCAQSLGIKLAADAEMDQFFTVLNTALNKSVVCDTSRITPSEGGGGYYAHIMTVRSFQETADTRNQVRNARIPALIMKGQCDNQKWGYTSEYLDLYPEHEFHLIPNAGHSIALEQPELYINTISNFLK